MSYNYNYSYGDTTAAGAGVLSGAAAIPSMLISIGLSILMIVSLWKIFEKCGVEGWKSIIPIYNIIVLFQLVDLKPWYVALILIPCVGPIVFMVFSYIAYIRLAKKLGKTNIGFAVLTVLLTPIALIILAFDKNCVVSDNATQQSVTPEAPTPVEAQPAPFNNPSPVEPQPTTFENPAPVVEQPTAPVVEQPTTPVVEPTPVEPVVEQPVPPVDNNDNQQ